MRPLITSLSILLLLVFISSVTWAEDFAFRKTYWGMTAKDVKASEPLKVVKEEKNLIGYKSSVIGKDVFIVYFFIEDQLVRSRYVLAETHSNKNDYIQDYKDFKSILEKKYGKPKEDDTIWKNDLYKDDYSGWGTAVGMGHLIYYSTWETAKSNISNILHGDNFDITGIVEYSSMKLKDLEKKAEEKKALDAF